MNGLNSGGTVFGWCDFPLMNCPPSAVGFTKSLTTNRKLRLQDMHVYGYTTIYM